MGTTSCDRAPLEAAPRGGENSGSRRGLGGDCNSDESEGILGGHVGRGRTLPCVRPGASLRSQLDRRKGSSFLRNYAPGPAVESGAIRHPNECQIRPPREGRRPRQERPIRGSGACQSSGGDRCRARNAYQGCRGRAPSPPSRRASSRTRSSPPLRGGGRQRRRRRRKRSCSDPIVVPPIARARTRIYPRGRHRP